MRATPGRRQGNKLKNVQRTPKEISGDPLLELQYKHNALFELLHGCQNVFYSQHC